MVKITIYRYKKPAAKYSYILYIYIYIKIEYTVKRLNGDGKYFIIINNNNIS